MKRSCNNCKALTYTNKLFCSLGYKTETKKEYKSIVSELKPSENCPKPKTNDEYVRLLKQSK